MASKNKWYQFQGKAHYMKIYEPDFYEGVGKYKAPLLVTDEVEKAIKATGIRRQFKDVDDGRQVTFTRDFEKKFRDELVYFCPPSIYDKNGKALVEYYNKETNQRVTQFSPQDKDKIEMRGNRVLIGNGSLVELTVSTYDAGKFKGSRLEQIRIIDLIEYSAAPRTESELANAEGVPFNIDAKIEVPEKKPATPKIGW